MHLTKSLFIDFCDYPKLARWKANNPLVYKKICKIETEEAEEHIMAIWQAVEDKVKELLEMRHNQKSLDLMPRFHKIKDEDSDDDDEVLMKAELDLPKALADTITAIQNKVEILYQPTFQYGDCLVRADFMVWNGKWYDLIEAKAKSSIRKSIKDDGEDKKIGSIESKFINDISFQVYVINKVLEQHNLWQINITYFAYLNKEYTKNWPLDIRQLITQDLAGNSKEIEVIQRNKPVSVIVNDALISVSEVEWRLDKMRTYLTLSEEEANKQFLRWWTRYLEYFWEDKPFWTVMGMWIHHSNASYIQDLFYQNRIVLADLTDDEIDWFNDNAQQFIARYKQCKKSGRPIINESKIKEVFNGFSYPICFYDYESINVPVPFLDNTRPYMQTVVQYSLHKYYENGSMKHYGWVFVGEWEYGCTEIKINDNQNAVDYECDRAITGSYKDLLNQMIEDIGDDLVTSTFIVWHEWFENTRNKEIAKLFPDLADAYLTINNNTYDLKKIVSEWYYFNTACKGSSSIKKVLPVLVPSMSYDNMEIGRWDVAMLALHKLITNETPVHERDQIIKHLLLYCWQDTLAMVRIYEAIKWFI